MYVCISLLGLWTSLSEIKFMDGYWIDRLLSHIQFLAHDAFVRTNRRAIAMMLPAPDPFL